jgi:hypothetical protein
VCPEEASTFISPIIPTEEELEPEEEASEVEGEEFEDDDSFYDPKNEDEYVCDHVSTNNDQAAAALFEQNQVKEGSLLKKRAHAISKLSALNNEFNDEF